MKVIPIKRDTYLSWVLEKHYAKRLCNIMYAFGLFIDKKLEGVITFGMPPSSTLGASICGNDYKSNVLELNRLITNDDLPKNTLSRFLISAVKMLPKPKIIISFADENFGHRGYIYQATNFIYTGMSSNTKQLIDKDGNEFHFRNIGHYQKDNRLSVGLVKRRKNEREINKLDIANYLRENKGEYKAKDLDKIFGYKDTAPHWFRLDAGFSFPTLDDWVRLKEILGFDDTYDKIMNDYEMIPDSNEIIKKLGLQEKEILGKHRYIYLHADKRDKKDMLKKFKLSQYPYPKGQNNSYFVDKSQKSAVQLDIFL